MSGTLHRVVLVFSGVLLLLILATIAMSMNRGFDFQDETFYMLCYDYTNIYREGISSYHVIVHRLLGWAHPGILTYRLASLALTLLSSYVLYRGLYKWFDKHMPGEVYFSAPFLFTYVFIANCIHYCTGVQTVNYNILINTIIISCTGIILGLFAHTGESILKNRGRLGLVLLIGILCAFSFFIKFSTGILQVAAYSALFFVYYLRQSFKVKAVLIATLFAGCAVGAVIYFLLFQGYTEWQYNFITSYRDMTKPSDHPPGALLQSYLKDVVDFLTFFRVNLYWVVALPILLLANRRWSGNKLFVLGRNLLIAGAVVYFVYRLAMHQFHRSNFIREWGHHTGYFYPIIMIIAAMLLVAAGINQRVSIMRFLQARFHLVIVTLFLLFTPLLAAIGTSNSLFLNLLFNAAPWLCVILILLAYTAKHTSYTVSGILVALTLLFTTAQIVDGNTFAPYYSIYRTEKTNILDQTEKADQIPQLEGIYVDSATKQFLLGMRTLLEPYHLSAAYPMWSFLSGPAYLMGGVQIEEFWYNKTCEGTHNFGLPQKLPVFIIADCERCKKPNADLLACLRNMGINYPDDYQAIGQVWFPHFKTYAIVQVPRPWAPPTTRESAVIAK